MLYGTATKRCAIWCVLDQLCGSYSLTEVIEEQVKMLAMHGYPCELWMLETWKLEEDPRAQALLAAYPQVRILPVLPRLRLYDYNNFSKPLGAYADEGDPVRSFHEKAAHITRALEGRLAEIDCVLAHDILFQTWYLPHGCAARTLADLHPHVRWFHWQHSGPGARPDRLPAAPHSSRFTPMKNSRFVYLNEDPRERERVAAVRGIAPEELSFVPNSRDILEYLDAPPEAKRFIRTNGLLDADLLIVIPARLDEGKQPKKALMFLWALRAAGIDARLIWCAAYANPSEPRHAEYLQHLWEQALALGLPEFSFRFTNETREWADFMPRACVRTFQQIGDLFVLPSLSEAHSLVAMEAAINRQVLVLNEDFQPMSSWFPPQASHPVKFGSRLQISHYHPPGRPQDASLEHELNYYFGEAQKIVHGLEANPCWRAFSFQKRRRNLGYVFKNHLERVLWSI